jgi:hypothetical protein|tara:strand:+ start:2412 stop:2759 length:348 start_codon:yes stop_codon:yes gene_type:complete
MGYRSDVALAITPARAVLLKELVKKDDNLAELINDADTNLAWDDPKSSTEAVKFLWTHIKWYDCNPDIQAIDNFLANSDDDEYLLLRVGEEEADITREGYYHDSGMWIQRTISWE